MAPAASSLHDLASSPEADEAKSHKDIYRQLRRVVSTYETVPTGTPVDYRRHPDGWYMALPVMVSSMVAQQCFEARHTDVLLATIPKCGTTWIKALLYAAAHRSTDDGSAVLRQLASHNSHELVPFLEIKVYVKEDRIPDLSSLAAPRLFATHVPAGSLPPSVVASGGKVVYLCRDPKDCFVSLWHFTNKMTPWDIHDALCRFCDGVTAFGPFWEHALSYWRLHLERPTQVLFLTYEELSADTPGQLRRIADFIGRPFTPQELNDGVDREIAETCAMESMAKQEENQSGTTEFMGMQLPNGTFFRRGVVGDWPNYLTPEMADKIDGITRTKFQGTGLLVRCPFLNKKD